MEVSVIDGAKGSKHVLNHSSLFCLFCLLVRLLHDLLDFIACSLVVVLEIEWVVLLSASPCWV